MGYKYLGWSEDLYGQVNVNVSKSSNAYPGHWHSRTKNRRCSTHVKKIQGKVGTTKDGIFGPKTQAGVKSFQRKAKIKVDGIVGPVTWRKMF